jgi:hypothetical protein
MGFYTLADSMSTSIPIYPVRHTIVNLTVDAIQALVYSKATCTTRINSVFQISRTSSVFLSEFNKTELLVNISMYISE